MAKADGVWAKEGMVERARHLWDVEGFSSGEITYKLGKEFGVALTRNAICAAARRYNFASRPPAIKERKTPETTREPSPNSAASLALARSRQKPRPKKVAPARPAEDGTFVPLPGANLGQRLTFGARPGAPARPFLPPLLKQIFSYPGKKPCCWPMMGHIDADGRPILSKIHADPLFWIRPCYCDEPTIPGSPYCPKHWAISAGTKPGSDKAQPDNGARQPLEKAPRTEAPSRRGERKEAPQPLAPRVRRGRRQTGASGAKGVVRNHQTGRFRAQAWDGKSSRHLGYFATLEEAAAAVAAAEARRAGTERRPEEDLPEKELQAA